jgi:hypothetical protein
MLKDSVCLGKEIFQFDKIYKKGKKTVKKA